MMFTDLPAVNATLNSLSMLFLTAGFVLIKRGNKTTHRNCMVAAFVTSTLFLLSYVYYHYQMQKHYGAAHTKFVDPAWFRPIYLVILLTHLIGAFAIVPLVTVTFFHAFKGNFEAHKKIARWTWPIWMYVSATGVLIYFLLYQIFPQK